MCDGEGVCDGNFVTGKKGMGDCKCMCRCVVRVKMVLVVVVVVVMSV